MRPASLAAALVLAASLGAQVAIAQDDTAITGEAALRTLFTEQTFYGHTREGSAWTEYYRADGKSAYREGDCVTPGEWRVSENGACFAYPTFESGEIACYRLFRDGDQIDFVPDEGGDSDADFLTESIKPGNAEQLPMSMTGSCGS
jgi:hypothetical protein